MVRVRSEGRVEHSAVHVAIGIGMDGNKEVLGLWTTTIEGARFWLQVSTDVGLS